MSFFYNRNAYLFSFPAELLLHAAEALSSAVDREWAVRNVMISEFDRDCVDSRLSRFVEDLNETGLDFLASELRFRRPLDRYGKASIACNSPPSIITHPLSPPYQLWWCRRAVRSPRSRRPSPFQRRSPRPSTHLRPATCPPAN